MRLFVDLYADGSCRHDPYDLGTAHNKSCCIQACGKK